MELPFTGRERRSDLAVRAPLSDVEEGVSPLAQLVDTSLGCDTADVKSFRATCTNKLTECVMMEV